MDNPQIGDYSTSLSLPHGTHTNISLSLRKQLKWDGIETAGAQPMGARLQPGELHAEGKWLRAEFPLS